MSKSMTDTDAHKTDRTDGIIVPLSEKDLDLLQWLGEWTPEIHRLAWNRRRQWPPGFRGVADTTVYSRHMEQWEAEKSVPPDKRDRSRLRKLIAYDLAEGTWTCARLTVRGRCALKLYGRPVPNQFDSHCIDIFDDVLLTPAMNRHTRSFDPHAYGWGKRPGEELPDTAEVWRLMLQEYNEDDYRGSGTLNGASARCTIATGSRYLNGSMREHDRYVSISVTDADGTEICDIALSTEGLTELLVSMTSVPVTVDSYWGKDGMRRMQPVPPPVSITDRINNRLQAVTNTQEQRLQAIIDEIALIPDRKLGKKAKSQLLQALQIAKDNCKSGVQFVATQAVEEVQIAAESIMALAAERVAGSEYAPLLTMANAEVRGLLTGPDKDVGDEPIALLPDSLDDLGEDASPEG